MKFNPRIIQPITLAIFGTGLFIVWSWFSMSDLDYRPGSDFFGLQTARWFKLGLPVMALMGIAASLPFCFLARRYGVVTGWLALVFAGGLTIGYTFLCALPYARLSSAFSIELPPETKIVHLQVSDTFNDGTNTFGTFTGSPELLAQISDSNGLEQSEGLLYMLQKWLNNDSIPDQGLIHRNELIILYFDSSLNLIHFHHRSSLPNP